MDTSVLEDKTYLIDAVAGDEYGYGLSNRVVNRVAHALIGLGLKKGDRIGFLMVVWISIKRRIANHHRVIPEFPVVAVVRKVYTL